MDRKREDIIWAAGIFEGEGSIVWAKVRNRNPKLPPWEHCQLSLHMCDEDIVRRFVSIVGVGNVHGPYTYTDSKVPQRKPSWYWSVSSFERVQAVIAMFWPWLGKRRKERAREVLKLELQKRPNRLKGPQQDKKTGRFI